MASAQTEVDVCTILYKYFYIKMYRGGMHDVTTGLPAGVSVL